MSNMRIYDRARACPPEAQRIIQAGKLKGKTDINPMWRIKLLTELFGPCGIGWKTANEQYWTTPGANGEVIAWCSIQLIYKEREAWSEPVTGIGGSMMVDTQRGQLASNDEAFKMAYTDAISVACKALGFAADVYWEKDKTKYSGQQVICTECGEVIKPYKNASGKTVSVEEHIEASMNAFGQTMCQSCCLKKLAQQNTETIAERAEEKGVAVNRA